MITAAPPRWEALYAEAYAERLRYLAGCNQFRFRRDDGMLAVETGSPSNTDNGVVCMREDISDTLVADVVDWFRYPASWICAGFDATDDLRERLGRAGLREERSGVTSGAELHDRSLPAPEAPDGVVITPAASAEDLDDWLLVARRIGIVDEPGQRPLPVRHWVARRDGRPVGLATAFFLSTTVLLEHVAVIEEERGRGIGTALALVRLHEARRLGCRSAVFGTTPESARLYEPLGFTTQPVAGGRWFYLPLER